MEKKTIGFKIEPSSKAWRDHIESMLKPVDVEEFQEADADFRAVFEKFYQQMTGNTTTRMAGGEYHDWNLRNAWECFKLGFTRGKKEKEKEFNQRKKDQKPEVDHKNVVCSKPYVVVYCRGGDLMGSMGEGPNSDELIEENSKQCLKTKAESGSNRATHVLTVTPD